MSNFHIVLMYCIPSPLAALKSRIETFWYWLTQVHLDNGHKYWEREMETEREREREREMWSDIPIMLLIFFLYILFYSYCDKAISK